MNSKNEITRDHWNGISAEIYDNSYPVFEDWDFETFHLIHWLIIAMQCETSPNEYDYDQLPLALGKIGVWARYCFGYRCGIRESSSFDDYKETYDTSGVWFDDSGNLLRTIPDQCISECSAIGDVYPATLFWTRTLSFLVPNKKLAVDYLVGYGAWNQAELYQKSIFELSEIVLWIACCDIKESGEWFGLVS